MLLHCVHALNSFPFALIFWVLCFPCVAYRTFHSFSFECFHNRSTIICSSCYQLSVFCGTTFCLVFNLLRMALEEFTGEAFHARETEDRDSNRPIFPKASRTVESGLDSLSPLAAPWFSGSIQSGFLFGFIVTVSVLVWFCVVLHQWRRVLVWDKQVNQPGQSEVNIPSMGDSSFNEVNPTSNYFFLQEIYLALL